MCCMLLSKKCADDLQHWAPQANRKCNGLAQGAVHRGGGPL
jgi:hypothetical protein